MHVLPIHGVDERGWFSHRSLLHLPSLLHVSRLQHVHGLLSVSTLEAVRSLPLQDAIVLRLQLLQLLLPFVLVLQGSWMQPAVPSLPLSVLALVLCSACHASTLFMVLGLRPLVLVC